MELKRLHSDGAALPSHLRGTIYEVRVSFEDLEAINYCFGVSWQRMSMKLVKEFAPLLIKLIDSELRKDSRRMTEKTNLLLKKPQPEFTRKKGGAEDDDEGMIEEEDEEMEEELDIQEDLDLDLSNDLPASERVPSSAKVS